MRTTTRANNVSQDSYTQAGPSDPRAGSTRRICNPSHGAVAGARAAYTTPVRPMPIYRPASPARAESTLKRVYARMGDARDVARERSRAIVPKVRAAHNTVSMAAASALASVRGFIRANRNSRPYAYPDNMIGGQGSSRVLDFSDIAREDLESEPVFVLRSQPARDALADVSKHVRLPVSSTTPVRQAPDISTPHVPDLNVHEATLAALEGRPPPRDYGLRRGLASIIDQATTRRDNGIRRREVSAPSRPPVPCTRPPTYRSCLSSGRAACKDVSFEDNHDKRVTLWDMAAPDLDKTPDHSPTPTLTTATDLGLPVPRTPVNPRTVNLNKPQADSPESSLE